MVSNPARRIELCDAGLRVLAQAGVRGVTHRALDAEAGLPPGTAVNYFRTRDAVLQALADRIVDRLSPDPDRVAELSSAAAGLDSFADHIRFVVERTMADPSITVALMELRLESRRSPELARTLGAMLAGNYRNDVEYNTAAGLLGESADIALLHYAVDGLLLDRLTTPIEPDKSADEIVDTLVARLMAPTVNRSETESENL